MKQRVKKTMATEEVQESARREQYLWEESEVYQKLHLYNMVSNSVYKPSETPLSDRLVKNNLTNFPLTYKRRPMQKENNNRIA